MFSSIEKVLDKIVEYTKNYVCESCSQNGSHICGDDMRRNVSSNRFLSYFPNLKRSEFYQFPNLKKLVDGAFGSNVKVEKVVNDHFTCFQAHTSTMEVSRGYARKSNHFLNWKSLVFHCLLKLLSFEPKDQCKLPTRCQKKIKAFFVLNASFLNFNQ